MEVKATLMFHFEGEKKKLLEADCVLKAKHPNDKVGFSQSMMDVEDQLIARHIKIEWEFNEDTNDD